MWKMGNTDWDMSPQLQVGRPTDYLEKELCGSVGLAVIESMLDKGSHDFWELLVRPLYL